MHKKGSVGGGGWAVAVEQRAQGVVSEEAGAWDFTFSNVDVNCEGHEGWNWSND